VTLRKRIAIFVAIAVFSIGGALAYLRLVGQRSIDIATPTRSLTVRWIEKPPPEVPGLFFRSTVSDDSFGRVGFVPIDALDGPRYLTPLTCDRLYVRGGVGTCLTSDLSQPLAPHQVALFDRRFAARAPVRLTGMPSRTRVSPDGRWAAITVFESGHSYAEGGFSTRTSLIDTTTGVIATDLEQFDVRRDGQPFKAVDFNFWGMTFTPDSREFYATLATAGQILLIRGNIASRSATVVHDGVECPSLSPNGQRIAFKKRITSPLGVRWRIAILDLASRQELELSAEDRSVDDQVDWLDDDHVIYHRTGQDGSAIWALPVDNREPPRLLLPGAYSPSVVR
jgi:hypothetical protein